MTVMPASFTNEVVMMKKMSRLSDEIEHRRQIDAGVLAFRAVALGRMQTSPS